MKQYDPTRQPMARLTLTELECRVNPVVGFEAFGAAPGGLPLVEVALADGTSIAQFEAYDSAFRGGVRAVVAELDGNPNTLEVITAPGPGGGPHIRVFQIDLATNALSVLTEFLAFEPNFTGGVRLAAGNVGGPDARQEIILGADAGGGPRVQVFGLEEATVVPIAGPLADFFAFDPNFRGGVRVAAGELDGDPLNGDELVVAAGIGGGPHVRVIRSDGVELSSYFAYQEDFLGGVNVAVTPGTPVGQLITDTELIDFSQRNFGLNTTALAAVSPSVAPFLTDLGLPGFPGVPSIPDPSVVPGLVGTPSVIGLPGLAGVIDPISGGLFTTGTTPVFSPGTLPVISDPAQAGTLGGGAPLLGGGAPLINELGLAIDVANLFSPFPVGAIGLPVAQIGPLGVAGTFGLFGDPGPLVPLPPLINPPFTGPVIGTGGLISGELGVGLLGPLPTIGLVPIGG